MHGGGEIQIADANELLELLINLVDGGGNVSCGLILNCGIGASLHAQRLLASGSLDLSVGGGKLTTGSNGVCKKESAKGNFCTFMA